MIFIGDAELAMKLAHRREIVSVFRRLGCSQANVETCGFEADNSVDGLLPASRTPVNIMRRGI